MHYPICEFTAPTQRPTSSITFSDSVFQWMVMLAYFVRRDITVHLSGLTKVTSIPVSHQTREEKHLILLEEIARGKCVH